MLEQIAAYFYDPIVFWGSPLLIVGAWTGLRRSLGWWAQRRHP